MKALLTPHVTEKSYRILESSDTSDRTYTFKISPRLDKGSVKSIVEKQFKVSVEAVNIIRLPGKTRRFKGIVGKTNQIKKAIVRLKKGDSIPGFEVENNNLTDKE